MRLPDLRPQSAEQPPADLGTSPSSCSLNNSFPHRICINLARRADRWAKVQEQFLRHGAQVARWNAVDGNAVTVPQHWPYSPGAYGCTLSHVASVREASAQGCDCLLIFEDDVELHPQFQELFPRFMAQLPEDWDALYFGGIHRSDPVPVTANIARLTESNSTYAYALRNTAFDAFIKLNEGTQRPVDETAKTLQKQFNFYCFIPHLAWVSRDYSDVLGAEVNHWWLQNGIAINGAEIEALASQTVGLVFPSRQRGPLQRSVLELILPPLCALFPELIVLARPGDLAGLTEARVPPNCRFCSCDGSISFDPIQLARKTMGTFQSRWNYLFACSADTCVSPWEVRAGLHHCLNHDLVVPGETPVKLTAQDTRKALEMGPEKVDTRPYPRRPGSGQLPGFFITSRSALTRGVPFSGSNLSGARIFRSPSRPLRLLIES